MFIVYHVQQVLSRSAKTLYESCIDTVNYEAFFKGENSTCFCTVVHSLVVVFFLFSTSHYAWAQPQDWLRLGVRHRVERKDCVKYRQGHP